MGSVFIWKANARSERLGACRRCCVSRLLKQEERGKCDGHPGCASEAPSHAPGGRGRTSVSTRRYENRKFVEFLDAVPTAVATRRRAGQDVLVALADQPDLLNIEIAPSPEPRRKRSALRGDLFRAFTTIPPSGRRYWYSRIEDCFTELDADQNDPALVPVPSETIGGALADRADFAAALAEQSVRNSLVAALKDPSSALGNFARQVKELHLERAWHVFRLGRLTDKVRAWAAEHRVEWNPSWSDVEKSSAGDAATVSSRETNSFLSGLMRLGPEDAKRVLVPLDIVLRLMRRD